MPYKVFKPTIEPPLIGIERLHDAVEKANETPGSRIHNGLYVIASSPTTVAEIQQRERNF